MKKGFSLLVLVIVVAVLLIIVTATTIGVSNAQKNIKVLTFSKELAIIKDKVDIYYKKSGSYPTLTSGATVTINVSSDLEQYNGEQISDGNVTLNYLDLEKIFEENGSLTDEIHTLNYGLQTDADDVYLISTITSKVYYKKGVYGYYTLTDELKEKIGYVEQKEEGISSISNVIFVKSTDNYTRNPIVTTIKVPEEYDATCRIYSKTLNGYQITSYDTVNGYKVYTTPDNINSNYHIIVSYNNNGNEVTATYNVYNFDNTVPHIEVYGNKKEIVNNITNEVSSFYYINYYDNESEIEEIKYANLKVESDSKTDIDNLNVIREYMKVNGTKVNGNILTIPYGTRWITIYVKDFAGNESYLYKQVPEIEKTANTDIPSSVNETEYNIIDSHDLVN